MLTLVKVLQNLGRKRNYHHYYCYFDYYLNILSLSWLTVENDANTGQSVAKPWAEAELRRTHDGPAS